MQTVQCLAQKYHGEFEFFIKDILRFRIQNENGISENFTLIKDRQEDPKLRIVAFKLRWQELGARERNIGALAFAVFTIADELTVIFTIFAKEDFLIDAERIQILQREIDAGVIREHILVIGTEQNEGARLVVVIPLQGIEPAVHVIDIAVRHVFGRAFAKDQAPRNHRRDIYGFTVEDLFQSLDGF